VLAIIACVGYAVWAFTARRGIFADFADNQTVSLGRAQSSDHADTVLLVVAGALAVIAIAVWLIRVLAGKARGGGLTVAGFVVSLVGMVVVVVGLVMSGNVDSAATRVGQGQHAEAATVVTGVGFVILAVGLAMGLLVARPPRESGADPAVSATPQQAW
jgi:hypothetical protein